MYCAYCGSQVGDNDKFCQSCGKPTEIGMEAAAPAVQPAPEPEPQPAVQQPAAQQPVVQPQPQPAPAPAPMAEPAPEPEPEYDPTRTMPITAYRKQQTEQRPPAPSGSPIAPPSGAPASNQHVVVPVKDQVPKQGNAAATVKKLDTRIIYAIVGAVIVLAILIAGFATGWFGLAGGTQVKDSVNDYTWEELAGISAQIADEDDSDDVIELAKKYNLTNKDGKLAGDQTKELELDDGTKVEAQIIGFNHDTKSNGDKAGITFLLKNVVDNHAMNQTATNVGGWAESGMRGYLNGDMVVKLPEELQDAIVSVEKKTNNTGQATDPKVVTATNDKLWLLSAAEICGNNIEWKGNGKGNAVANAEGSQYKLFADQGIDAHGESHEILVKSFDGKACKWWTRTAIPANAKAFRGITDKGGYGVNEEATAKNGVAFGFCL